MIMQTFIAIIIIASILLVGAMEAKSMSDCISNGHSANYCAIVLNQK